VGNFHDILFYFYKLKFFGIQFAVMSLQRNSFKIFWHTICYNFGIQFVIIFWHTICCNEFASVILLKFFGIQFAVMSLQA
jgi:hypothetical protein